MKDGKGSEAGGPRRLGSGRAWDDEVDALFQLVPPEFVAARNALAARLKKEGETSAANWVKALPKPSISAWTVNQLYWRHRTAFDKLLQTGERFRQAQAAQLGGRGASIRGPLNDRREALSQMARLAADTLQKSSGSAPPGVMRRVTATLEALSSYGALPGAPRAGRLVDDVEPPGFETLAALVPQVGRQTGRDTPSRLLSFERPPSRPRPARRPAPTRTRRDSEKERRARLAAEKRAREKAERSLARARKGAQAAEARLKKAATRAKQTEKAMVAAEARLQKLAAAAHSARQSARRAAAEAEAAAQAVEDAELALKRTRHTD